MQRFYETVFLAGLVAMAICTGLGFLVGLGVPALWEFAWAPWVAFVGPLIVVCLALRCLSYWWPLRWPRAMSRSRFLWLYWAAWLVVANAMAYGIWWWPAAPLSACGGVCMDKTGKLYSHGEFEAFERWEAVMNYHYLALAIGSVIGLPDGTSPSRSSTAGQRRRPRVAEQSIRSPASRRLNTPRARSESVYRQAGQLYGRRR